MFPPAPQPAPTSTRARVQLHPGLLLAAGVLALTTACGGGESFGDDTSMLDTDARELLELQEPEQSLSRTGIITNGIITNGIITNGIITNGLSLDGTLSNGLARNGLGAQGLASPAFASWFSAYPEADGDMAMHYIVACAVPSGERRSWSNPTTGTRFTWEGVLGLAPGWARGRPASVTEQQLVSACLAAMVNKYGVHVPVAVRGRDATGLELAVASGEDLFTLKEAAFFGNLFTHEGLFVCSDRAVLDPAESSARACGLFSRADGLIEDCQPLVHVGLCPWSCQKTLGKSFYESCTVDGRKYPTVTTRLRREDVYRCGDGACQVSESCDASGLGLGTTADSCFADCGLCQ